jgi:hypothetical protein
MQHCIQIKYSKITLSCPSFFICNSKSEEKLIFENFMYKNRKYDRLLIIYYIYRAMNGVESGRVLFCIIKPFFVPYLFTLYTSEMLVFIKKTME